MANQRNEWLATRWSLISRLKNWDDHESWREFFDLYWKLIYGVALKAGLTPTEAQDVVQETIISVCKKIKEFKADPAYGSFKGWLLKLTRWRIQDEIRRRPREEAARQHPPARLNDSTAAASTVAQIPDPSADVLERVWDNEWERNLLSAALERLERQVQAKHYQVFYLHVIKQYPVEKVAQVARIKANQVYVIKHRLGMVFKALLEELEKTMS